MLEKISPALSKKVVEMLVADGHPVSRIAKDARTSPAFLGKVLAGKATLTPEHLDRLDDAHPELPFRIGGAMVKEEVIDLARKAKGVAKKVGLKGGEVAGSVARNLRKGAWKLLNGVLGGGEKD